MELEETTNQILSSLQNDINLELTDCRGQGDRIAAAILQRISNALQRNIERRTARENAEPIEQTATEQQILASSEFGKESLIDEGGNA